ncbi:putative cation-transporting ATPase [Smittium culicis]|uniref:Putative cation-transporting ATPase n=1 Tax=Smittium culicis TaxID=133412 RepID=A0A1R1XBU3_9FUNG|nr:putative cation-transporting ATPase [Smittium culicis]OMJ24460.1 putative cation-transporting ATPase [Smittium culicis]
MITKRIFTLLTCIFLPSLTNSAPVFNIGILYLTPFLLHFYQVNDKGLDGDVCPLPTLMRLECPLVCVTDINLCPDPARPSCGTGETYCADGVCRTSCPENLLNPCLCGVSSSLLSQNTLSLIPCNTFIARNITSYNATISNENKNVCLSQMGLGSIEDWSYNITGNSVYLSCPSVEVPPLTLREPAFMFFWILIASQAVLFSLWSAYRRALDKNSVSDSKKNSLNEFKAKEISEGSDYLSKNNVSINHSEKSHLSNASSTLDNDTRGGDGGVKLQGFNNSIFGSIVLYYVHFNTLALIVFSLIICLDYYGLITGTGAGLTHGDYDYSGALFIINWSYMAFWVIALVIFRDKVNNYFKIKTRIRDAKYIQVLQNRENVIFQKDSYGTLVELVLRIEKRFNELFSKNSSVTTCKVETNSSNAKFFEYNCTRYVYNPELDFYESISYSVGENNNSILELKSGLTSEEAEKRLGYLGLNFISVTVPSLPKALFYEGLANTVVILISAITKVYVKIKAETRVKKLAEFEDTANVIRSGKPENINTKNLVIGDVLILDTNKIAPCDLILLSGNVTVDESSLTGEAMPVRKIPLKSNNIAYDKYASDKISTILSGTMILQSKSISEKGALALVTAVGTSSEKGKLIHKILFPKQIQFIFNLQMRVIMAVLTIQGLIWFGMILWLLKKSAVASWFSAMYALVEIISPILPAALVIGQTIAVGQLKKKNIFCVDVPRVVVAGKIQIFCFDKTGTLTNSFLDYFGISQVSTLINNSDTNETHSQSPTLGPITNETSKYSKICTLGLASCHSVSELDGELIGNPVDIEMFKNTGWTLKTQSDKQNPLIVPPNNGLDASGKTYEPIQILKEFEFQHHRQSMSVCVQEVDSGNVYSFVKGSFEKIAEIVDPKSVPSEYFDVAKNLAKEGCYVLALAYKSHGKADASKFANIDRDQVESDVRLGCIIAFRNELKHDTRDALNEISMSNTRNVMITGDTTLTGVHIARQCEMIKKGYSVILGDIDSESNSLSWKDVDTNRMYSNDEIFGLLPSNVELALSGKAFTFICNIGKIRDILLRVRVFGRMTPQNKVVCVNLHMEKGITAMCGDGGNDCGALRAAHVGLALSNSEASIVSPFSSTNKSIYSCVELISQGRGAIATSFANYKFLILYGQTMAMFKAFSMYYSVTISQPVWITVDAFISVGMCLSISLSKPISKLSPTRPTAKLLGAQTLASALGQIIINWLYMIVLFIILYKQSWFKCHEFDSSTVDFKKWWLLGDNYESEILGLVIMIQFANCGLIYNFGYKFRQRWYKNYVLLAVYTGFISIFSYIMLSTPNRLGCMFRMNCGDPDVLESLGYKKPNFYIEPYNIPQGHNVIPKNFRLFLWIFCMSNILVGVIWETFVVLGPVGSFFKRKAQKSKTE